MYVEGNVIIFERDFVEFLLELWLLIIFFEKIIILGYICFVVEVDSCEFKGYGLIKIGVK